MTDLMQRLIVTRPTDDDLKAQWPSPDRAALLDRIHQCADQRPGNRRRRPVALLAAAAVVAACVSVSSLVNPEDATAADLRALALSAASHDGPVLQEGTWLHEETTSLQRNSATLSDGAVLDTDRESWTRWDGRVYLIEHRPSGGWTTYDVIAGDVAPSYASPTPQFAATLPDEPEQLLSYLDARVSGSSSHDEALFEALAGLATSHTLPPRTLAAAFEALAQVRHVQTKDVDVAGRPAVEVKYDEELTSSTEALVVDRATGQVLSTHQRSLQSDYLSTTQLSEVVPQIPADVRAVFTNHTEGVRYYS